MQEKMKLPSDELTVKEEIELPSHEFTVKGKASLIISYTEPPIIILRSTFSCPHYVLSNSYTSETKLPDEVSARLLGNEKLFTTWKTTIERAILLLDIYAKNEQADMTDDQTNRLRREAKGFDRR